MSMPDSIHDETYDAVMANHTPQTVQEYRATIDELKAKCELYEQQIKELKGDVASETEWADYYFKEAQQNGRSGVLGRLSDEGMSRLLDL